MSKHQSSDQGSSRSRPPAGRHPGDHAPKSRRRAAARARARRSTVKRSGKGPAEPERPPRAEKARTKSKKEKRHGHKAKPEVEVVRAYYHIQREETRWRLRCEAISGRMIEPMVRLVDIEEFHSFRRFLAQAGFSFGEDLERARRVHKDVMRQARRAARDREREFRLTSELGWHGDDVFVHPRRTYPAGARLRFEPEPKRLYAGGRKGGTFEGWLAEVAGPAACSSRMIFGIGADLMPLILRPAGKAAGGVSFNIEGPSRSGKSITLEVAKSGGDEPMLDSWGLSRAGGAAALLGHADLPIFLDETRAVRGGEARGGSIVGEVTRLLSGGRPDILDPGWMSEHRQEHGRGAIRSVLLASTEGRLDPARLAGERARMIAVPACRAGSFGVIDYPERADPPIRDAAAAGETIERLQRAAGRHHGHALPRFVRRLVGLGAGKRARLVERHRRAFFDAAGGAALEAWARSVLDWFALDYAALMLARRFGIVPWSKAVILDAVMRCWRDAMGQEARVEDAPEVVAERLRRWLGGAPRRAAVGTDFDPRRLEKYEVVLDRDGDQPVALAQRKRLVGPAGGEAALDGALRLLLQRGEIVPNRETGEIPRQKRFAGTKTKLRFVFFKASFLAGTGGAGG